jgi:hypothetical protein
MISAFSVFFLLLMHPVHISMTSIDDVRDNDSMKVFVRMYLNDFPSDYKLQYISDGVILNSSQITHFPEELMGKYLNHRIQHYCK